ncbi:hypothetical protein RBB50_003784 [Rhinocladiella similis]
MRSLPSVAVAAFLAAAIPYTAASGYDDSMRLRYEDCSPSQDGSCSGCGADYVRCGDDTCYNPKAGETCCSSDYACPSGFNCSTTGSKCISADGKRHASFNCRYGENDNDDDDDSYNTTSSVLSTTTTITSTTTNTVTVSASTTSCDLAGSTTGLPLTSSVASYGNTTTVALNTTTSTLSVANATGASPTSNVTFNATKGRPSPTISPPINGYKGAASGLQGQSSASLFALGSLIFMSALLL